MCGLASYCKVLANWRSGCHLPILKYLISSWVLIWRLKENFGNYSFTHVCLFKQFCYCWIWTLDLWITRQMHYPQTNFESNPALISSWVLIWRLVENFGNYTFMHVCLFKLVCGLASSKIAFVIVLEHGRKEASNAKRAVWLCQKLSLKGEIYFVGYLR